jgi:DNA-binding MarR family transcriptional regulator
MTSTADALLDHVGDRAREQARAEARTVLAMLDFADARRADYEASGPGPYRDLELASIAHELAVELQMSVNVVQNRLHEAREVRGRTPSAWAAFLDGRIDSYRVQIISRALTSLREPGSDLTVDEKVVDYATGHTAGELRAWLKRLVARLEPDHHADRARDLMTERRVCVSHGDDGVSELWALLPTAQAAAIESTLHGAVQSKPADDARTVEQYVADELCRRLLTTADGESAVTVQLALTIPAASLAGLSDEPGASLDGQWVLPAETVRELATRCDTVFHRVVTDPLGRVLDVTRLGRFATGELAFALDVRDGVCQFPTCTRPSAQCDKDHRQPWPHGPTTGSNLWSLCRRHHRMKTAGIFTAHLDQHDQPVWVLPSGKPVVAERAVHG